MAYVKKACYGARGKLNIWAPKVTNKDEFSLSQIWVTNDIAGAQNTIEAGWMVRTTNCCFDNYLQSYKHHMVLS